MMTNEGPFRIPEKCKDCLSVAACLADFTQEEERLIDNFKTDTGSFLDAEEVYSGNLDSTPLDPEAREYFREKWGEAAEKIRAYTLQTQEIFDDIEQKCPGLTPGSECNYPE